MNVQSHVVIVNTVNKMIQLNVLNKGRDIQRSQNAINLSPTTGDSPGGLEATEVL